jgi:hypothetical protein
MPAVIGAISYMDNFGAGNVDGSTNGKANGKDSQTDTQDTELIADEVLFDEPAVTSTATAVPNKCRFLLRSKTYSEPQRPLHPTTRLESRAAPASVHEAREVREASAASGSGWVTTMHGSKTRPRKKQLRRLLLIRSKQMSRRRQPRPEHGLIPSQSRGPLN